MDVPLSVVFECERFRLALHLELMNAAEITQQIDRMIEDRPDHSNALLNLSSDKIADRNDLIHQLDTIVDGQLPPQLGFSAAKRVLLLMQPKISNSKISKRDALHMLVRLVEHGRDFPQWFVCGVTDLTASFEKAKGDLTCAKTAERQLDRFVIRAIMDREAKST